MSTSLSLVAIKKDWSSFLGLPFCLFIILFSHSFIPSREREREMGNCQAIDAATLVIQHPSGKVDKLYWPVTAREIMKMNPGHYVALLISTTMVTPNESSNNNETSKVEKKENEARKVEKKENEGSSNSVRLTRIKLLRPADTLVLGQVYRLITSKEVMSGLSAKKQAKVKQSQLEAAEKAGRRKERAARGSDSAATAAAGRSVSEDPFQATKHEKNNRPRTSTSTTSAIARSRTWQPSLHSISEAGS
ncbi:uncharacterized protein LOC111465553 isoform X2 [Cucurbita maxima]|uniref:Uncharacterized protein LOC111465553 isoform X2 n=1 Tax=Cucurbita maxima TaxID=3661 RepID=A0A6J1HRW5_CUCMA|nr:uncharacterized protein LOC111465553 isoform X2 [Cucurbita maxima]